ncbi:MAG TPA: glycosyltransferase [bacterium]
MTSRWVDGVHEISFSIIIPTYNRPRFLASCLESVAAQDYPSALVDVVVVDDGSDAPLDATIAPYRARLPVMLVRQDHGGPGAARNTGAAQGSGEFLVFLDDDCRPARDWLQALARHLKSSPDTVVGGPMSNGLPDNIYAVASSLLIEAASTYFNTDPSRATNLITGNLALSRADFHRVGGFDDTLMTAEDRDFCDRCREQGCRLVYAGDAVVWHDRPLTFRTFWAQHVEYGRGTFDYHRRRAERGTTRVSFDGGFYVHLVRYPLVHRRPRALALSVLLGLTQVAKTVGLLRQRMRRAGRRSMPSLEQERPLEQESHRG